MGGVKTEEFFKYLDELATKESAKEETIKGCKVKTEYQVLPENDKSKKRETIAKVITDAMKKMKK